VDLPGAIWTPSHDVDLSEARNGTPESRDRLSRLKCGVLSGPFDGVDAAAAGCNSWARSTSEQPDGRSRCISRIGGAKRSVTASSEY